jgi:exopolysaccharide biosynthesis polyprenyl glycosylphosphotransferase
MNRTTGARSALSSVEVFLPARSLTTAFRVQSEDRVDSNQPRSPDYEASAWSAAGEGLARHNTSHREGSGAGPLTALLNQHLSAEMLGLWVLEVLACTLVVYGVLSAGDAWQEMGEAKAAALALTFGATSVAVGLYDADVYMRTRQLLLSTVVGVVLALPAVWLVACALGIAIPHLAPQGNAHAVKLLFGFIVCLFAVRILISIALRSDMLARRLVVIGTEASAERTLAAIRNQHRGVYELAAVLPPEAPVLEGPQLRARGVHDIVLTGESGSARTAELRRERLRVYSEGGFWESQLRRINIDDPSRHWAGEGWSGPRGHSGLAAVFRQGFDIVLSVALLLFTAPLMIVASLAIKLDSPGPIIYRQERVGLGNKPFTVMKFRSMRADAEARGPMWASRGDSRVTRVGSFIRLVRIDELPQLINVLRGEMSFIGPRPERPHFVEQLQRTIPFYADRALVKPGLTGWAQVNYPYGASVEDARAKLSYDLYYVKHRGFLLDLLILLATVRVVLFQRGAR